MKPSIHHQGDSYYSPAQAREVLRQLSTDPDLPEHWVGQVCLHRGEVAIVSMLEAMRIDPTAIGRAYLAPAPMPGAPGTEKLTILDEKAKLGWASDLLKATESQPGGMPENLASLAPMYASSWAQLRDRKYWDFHMAPTLLVWHEASNKAVPLVLDTALSGEEPQTLLGWKKPIDSTSGTMYLFHGFLGHPPQLLQPAVEMTDILMSQSVARNFEIVMMQQPDWHQMEPLQAESYCDAYRGILRQYRDEGRAFRENLHPEADRLAALLDEAVHGKSKG
jgi:hypothetical protein